MATKSGDKLQLRQITMDDLPAIHLLSRAEHWSHREDDLAHLLSLGEGLAVESDGQIIGCIMWWDVADGITTLGAAIVARRHRDAGIDRLVLEAALARIGDRSVMANISAEHLPLYSRFGFISRGEIALCQGASFAAPLIPLGPGERIRPRGDGDIGHVNRLAAAATGLSRDRIMDLLHREAHGVVLDDNGTVTGCALFRRSGRGYTIGPVIAPDATRAKALIAQWLGSRSGEFIRLYVPEDRHLSAWLEELGLASAERVVTMVRGQVPSPADPDHSFALVSQALH